MAKKDKFNDKIVTHVGTLVCDTVDHLVEHKMLPPEYGTISLTIELLNGQQVYADVYVAIRGCKTIH